MLGKRWLWLGVFIVMVVACLLVTTPLSVLNYWLFPHIKLINPVGGLSKGRWQGVTRAQGDYPLSCDYQRIKGLTYQLHCQIPMQIKATLSLQGFNSWSMTAMTGTGKLEALGWLLPKGLPGQLSGDFNLSIDKAVIRNGQLSFLSLTGSGQEFAWSDWITFTTVSLTTLAKTQPIRLMLSAQSESQRAVTDGTTQSVLNQEKPALSIQAELTGNQYQLSGEIRGKGLTPYQNFLKTFTKQTQDQVYMIHWEGLLF